MAEGGTEMTTTTATYQVQGMTCEHCVNAVRTEIGALAGVQDVRVDLAAGTVTVDSDSPLPAERVREAVDEAGYELVGS
ncbi:heavy-metal-associated domain-containing protein [Plantactinospora sp. GCM10030261]|uniref:heavy-metal-associated domain-containing protein n=1 Tax=Plantactinospora sp. GCM10030261 TaxID=3273420 RepID=UPI00360FBF97